MFMAIMIAVVVQANAQAEFNGFTISADGHYRAADGKDYIIYQFEGKSAKDIWCIAPCAYCNGMCVLSTIRHRQRVAMHLLCVSTLHLFYV